MMMITPKKWPNYVRDYARKMHWSIFWPQILFLSPPPRLSMVYGGIMVLYARKKAHYALRHTPTSLVKRGRPMPCEGSWVDGMSHPSKRDVEP